MQSQPFDGTRMPTIFNVTSQRKTNAVHLHTNLVFAASFEVHFDQGIGCSNFDDAVVGDGELAFFGVLASVDYKSLAFPEIRFDGADARAVARFQSAFDHSHIAALVHSELPIVLHGKLDVLVLGKQHQTGCFTVQAVNHKNLVVGILAFYIFAQDAVGGADFFLRSGDGEQAGSFVHYDQMFVFVNYFELRVLKGDPAFAPAHEHFVAHIELVVELADDLLFNGDLLVVQQRLDGGAALVLEVFGKEIHENHGFAYGQFGDGFPFGTGFFGRVDSGSDRFLAAGRPWRTDRFPGCSGVGFLRRIGRLFAGRGRYRHRGNFLQR